MSSPQKSILPDQLDLEPFHHLKRKIKVEPEDLEAGEFQPPTKKNKEKEKEVVDPEMFKPLMREEPRYRQGDDVYRVGGNLEQMEKVWTDIKLPLAVRSLNTLQKGELTTIFFQLFLKKFDFNFQGEPIKRFPGVDQAAFRTPLYQGRISVCFTTLITPIATVVMFWDNFDQDYERMDHMFDQVKKELNPDLKLMEQSERSLKEYQMVFGKNVRFPKMILVMMNEKMVEFDPTYTRPIDYENLRQEWVPRGIRHYNDELYYGAFKKMVREKEEVIMWNLIPVIFYSRPYGYFCPSYTKLNPQRTATIGNYFYQPRMKEPEKFV